METRVEDVGPCKKNLHIELPPERVAEELDKSYTQLNETVTVPGFRPGHAPRWLMEGRFGDEVGDETRDTLMNEALQEAIKEHELNPVGEPVFEEDVELEPGEPLAFTVTLEVYPDFEIDGYKGIELVKSPAVASDEEIEQEIEAVRRRFADLKEVAEGTPQEDDLVLCDVRLTEDDEVYRDITDHEIIVGQHVLIGLNPEETVELLTGLTVGETTERTITLPEDMPDEDKGGSEMTLELELKGIRRPELPELTDEWAEEIGLDSVEELREEVKEGIGRRKEQQASSQLEEQLMDKLAESVDFELPEDVVKKMAERRLARQRLQMLYRGVSNEELESQAESLQKKSHEDAERAAKLFFILEKIADEERIFVTEDEVNARIDAMAAREDRSAAQVRRDLEREGELSDLRASMREEKLRSFLLEHAVITEEETDQEAPTAESDEAEPGK